MTKTQKTALEKLLKPNEVLIEFNIVEDGTDADGFPQSKIEYINPPLNYKLVRVISLYNCVILQDFNFDNSANTAN